MTDDELLTPAEVSAMTKGAITPGKLAQLRYRGGGPRFMKPTPRTVLYSATSVREWLAESERTSTRVTA